MKSKLFPHITVQKNVRFGKPVIAGTRTPVELIIGKVAGGMVVDDVAKEYNLTRDQVLAALQYAAYVISHEEVTTT